MFQALAGAAGAQIPFDAAVIVPTVLRPSLARAVRSIYAQDFPGRVQILIGIDVAEGDAAQLDSLAAECPDRMMLTVAALPYSTSVRHGGLYPNRYSGALRTILTYAANSPRVAYLDDDNWWLPPHLASLAAAIDGFGWAYSARWFADGESGETICLDDWESVGPGGGVFAASFGGFVDPSSLMIDKLRCHDVVPLWSMSPFADGSGEDRLVFKALTDRHKGNGTGRATSCYTIGEHDRNHTARLQQMRERGIVPPAERRAGRRTLVEATEGLPRGTAPLPATAGSSLLREFLTRLKPAELVWLGGEDVSGAARLAAVAASLSQSALTAASGGWDEAPLTHLPPTVVALAGDGAAFLARQHVSADLVEIDGTVTATRLAAGWTLLRRGGLLLGAGEPPAAVTAFTTEAAIPMLPAERDGERWWIVQKP